MSGWDSNWAASTSQTGVTHSKWLVDYNCPTEYTVNGVTRTDAGGLPGYPVDVSAPGAAGVMEPTDLTPNLGAGTAGAAGIVPGDSTDYADASNFVTVSSGLLLLYGIGTIIGPTVGGVLMVGAPYRLFLVTGLAHLAVAAYAIYRSTRRAAVPADERENFTSVPASRSATPESIALDPRANPAE